MRVLGAVPVALVGAGTGAASVALHDRGWGWWLLAAAAPLAAVIALPAGWWRAAFGAGWLLVLGLAVSPRPEGDYLVGATDRGMALLAVALVLLVACVATLPVRRRGEESDSGAGGT